MCIRDRSQISVFQLLDQGNNAAIHACHPPLMQHASTYIYVYLQIQMWLGKSLDPRTWERKQRNPSLSPVYITQTPATERILTVISCGCTQGCERKCKCVNADLRYTAMYKNFRGQNCPLTCVMSFLMSLCKSVIFFLHRQYYLLYHIIM